MHLDSFDDSLSRIESDCGLPEGFSISLSKEDDWSFVIRLHSLLEAATAQLLTQSLGRTELSDIFSALDISNAKTGKIAFIRALALLPKEHCDYIRSFSELRNVLVHRVNNVTIDLQAHFQSEWNNKAKKDRKKFVDKWAFAIKDGEAEQEPLARFVVSVSDQKTKKPLSRQIMLLDGTKQTLLASALAILDAISMTCRYGPHIWTFIMESEDRKMFIDKALEAFEKAKVGDPDYPFRVKERLERRNPNVKIKIDDDGQPLLESLAAAFYKEYLRLLAEL